MGLLRLLVKGIAKRKLFCEVKDMNFPSAKIVRDKLKLSEAFIAKQNNDKKEAERQARLINEYLLDLNIKIDEAIKAGKTSIDLPRHYFPLNSNSSEYIERYLEYKGYKLAHIMAGNYLLQW